MSKYGLIYIVSNSEQKKNLFKIGKTSRTIESRIKELNSATGTLGKFKAHATFLVADIDEVEIYIHNKLSKIRYQKNREFFESNYTELLLKVDGLIGNDCLKKQIITELDKKITKKIKSKKTQSEKEFFSSDIDMDSLLKASIEKKKNEKDITEKEAKEGRDIFEKFSNNQMKVYNTYIEKLKKSLKKYQFIHFHSAKIKWGIDCEVVFSPNDTDEINKSSKHHDKFTTPFKSDWGAIKIDFTTNLGSVEVEQLRRHYKWKDQYYSDRSSSQIYNINKVFKYLIEDFGKLILNHKDLQKEQKEKELDESDYRYFVDRSFGAFRAPYREDDEEDVDLRVFSDDDCDQNHALDLFLKHNKS